jgi:lysophospholipase L1-like esterase
MATHEHPKPSTSGHLLLVLAVALGALMPLYWIDEARSLRPSRVLGPVGLSGAPAAEPPTLPAPPAESPVAQREGPQPKGPHGATSKAEPAPSLKLGERGDKPPPRTEPATAGGVTLTMPAASAPAAAVRTGSVLPIEGVEHLRSFYSALARSERNVPVRVLHYGDSTLAGDGIAKTIRQRLKTQFGDGGPGFVVAGMDPRWMRRDDVRVSRSGEWDIYTILHGGNQGSGQALGQRLEIFAQKARRPEPLRLQINGTPATLRRVEHTHFDQWVVDHDVGIASTTLQISEAGLEVYGLVLEGVGGITWETTAVVGIASGSIRQFNAEHLAEQTRTRRPDLVVVMLGGNDAGNGGILSGEGRVYREGFMKAVGVLRQGAPQAACLIMSPLDQGTLGDDGRIYSKRTMSRMVALQRQASHEMGCAFWSSWDFMGGQNAFARWLEQGLAWTDLMHLTEKGLNRVGQGLTDALMQGYEQHRRGQ